MEKNMLLFNEYSIIKKFTLFVILCQEWIVQPLLSLQLIVLQILNLADCDRILWVTTMFIILLPLNIFIYVMLIYNTNTLNSNCNRIHVLKIYYILHKALRAFPNLLLNFKLIILLLSTVVCFSPSLNHP